MQSHKFSTILVTGANGFVGRQLCKEAFLRGQKVIAFTRKPYDFGLPIENRIIDDMLNPEINWVKHFEHVDVVYHLAARVHLMDDLASNPLEEYRKVNVLLTERLVQAAIAAGCGQFIYLSSIKVNGEETLSHQPFSAEDRANPGDPYGVSKWEAEQAIQQQCQDRAMAYTIIRPPLVYGPGVGANFLALIKLLRYPILLPFKSIHNHRSLINLDNLIDLLLCLIHNPGAKNQIFLASDNCDLSTPELFQKLIRILNSRARLLPFPPSLLRYCLNFLGQRRVADRLLGSLEIDIQKTKDFLGWRPPYSVDSGLLKTIKYYEAHREATI